MHSIFEYLKEYVTWYMTSAKENYVGGYFKSPPLHYDQLGIFKSVKLSVCLSVYLYTQLQYFFWKLL